MAVRPGIADAQVLLLNPPHRLQCLLRRRNAIDSARGSATNWLCEDLLQRAPRGRILITALTSPGRRIESSRPVKKALHAFGFRSNGSHRFLLGLSETERERRQVRSTVTAVTRLQVRKLLPASEVAEHPNETQKAIRYRGGSGVENGAFPRLTL